MPILNSERAQIAELALKNRLPAVYGQPEYVDNGGLIYYGPSVTAMFRRAATYVDKILKGTQPRRSARRAADEVRVSDQSQNGKTDRINNSS